MLTFFYNTFYLESISSFSYDEFSIRLENFLSLFRSYFPSVKSFLMDSETYLDHIRYAVRGRKAASLYDSLLTPAELETLKMLRDNPEKSRLEQERISIAYIKSRQ